MKHERPNSIVYNMDNMEFMASVPDKFYDLAVVDPPYGIGMDGGNVGYKGNNNFEKKNWDNNTPNKEYFEELIRISVNQIIFGGNYFGLPASRCWIIWDKGEGFYNRTYAECEMAWTSFDMNTAKFKFDPLCNGSYKGKIHPTQKPIELYDYTYSRFLPNGGKVIDTHLGSGSNRISAHKRGNIIFDACELDVDYFNDGNARFDEFIMKYEPAELHPITKQGQSKLF